MKIFAISDLHLSFQTDKPMDVFGANWENYEQRILEDWNSKVSSDDVGIIAGDISWAMKMEETKADFDFVSKLNGTKIIIRGNHDYWWKSISRIRETLPKDIIALQNDSIQIGNVVFCGTRGWRVPERYQKQDPEDKKIYEREIIRFELSLQDAAKKVEEQKARGVADAKLVAIIHYPPFNSQREDSPFTALCEKYGVSVCVYGHLHGKNCRAELYTEKRGIKYYLTSCDLMQHKVAEINL